MEGERDLEDALAIFVVAQRCQDRCLGADRFGADY